MIKKIYGLIAIAVIAILLTAGCTQPQQPPQNIVTPSVGITTPVQNQTHSSDVQAPFLASSTLATPGPTQTLPDQYSLTFQVQGNGNTVNPKIGVNLRGGNGLALDSQVDSTIFRTDGSVEQGSMFQPLHGGQQIVFNATNSDKNRVEIWVTAPTVGKIKVYDDYVPLK